MTMMPHTRRFFELQWAGVGWPEAGTRGQLVLRRGWNVPPKALHAAPAQSEGHWGHHGYRGWLGSRRYCGAAMMALAIVDHMRMAQGTLGHDRSLASVVRDTYMLSGFAGRRRRSV
jgi:hypothetical protein